MSFVQKQLLQLQQSPMVKKYEEALKTSLTYNYMLLQEELKVETIK